MVYFQEKFLLYIEDNSDIVVFCLIQLFMHLFIQRNHAVWIILYDFIGSILHLPHFPYFAYILLK